MWSLYLNLVLLAIKFLKTIDVGMNAIGLPGPCVLSWVDCKITLPGPSPNSWSHAPPHLPTNIMTEGVAIADFSSRAMYDKHGCHVGLRLSCSPTATVDEGPLELLRTRFSHQVDTLWQNTFIQTLAKDQPQSQSLRTEKSQYEHKVSPAESGLLVVPQTSLVTWTIICQRSADLGWAMLDRILFLTFKLSLRAPLIILPSFLLFLLYRTKKVDLRRVYEMTTRTYERTKSATVKTILTTIAKLNAGAFIGLNFCRSLIFDHLINIFTSRPSQATKNPREESEARDRAQKINDSLQAQVKNLQIELNELELTCEKQRDDLERSRAREDLNARFLHESPMLEHLRGTRTGHTGPSQGLNRAGLATKLRDELGAVKSQLEKETSSRQHFEEEYQKANQIAASQSQELCRMREIRQELGIALTNSEKIAKGLQDDLARTQAAKTEVEVARSKGERSLEVHKMQNTRLIDQCEEAVSKQTEFSEKWEKTAKRLEHLQSEHDKLQASQTADQVRLRAHMTQMEQQQVELVQQISALEVQLGQETDACQSEKMEKESALKREEVANEEIKRLNQELRKFRNARSKYLERQSKVTREKDDAKPKGSAPEPTEQAPEPARTLQPVSIKSREGSEGEKLNIKVERRAEPSSMKTAQSKQQRKPSTPTLPGLFAETSGGEHKKAASVPLVDPENQSSSLHPANVASESQEEPSRVKENTSSKPLSGDAAQAAKPETAAPSKKKKSNAPVSVLSKSYPKPKSKTDNANDDRIEAPKKPQTPPATSESGRRTPGDPVRTPVSSPSKTRTKQPAATKTVGVPVAESTPQVSAPVADGPRAATAPATAPQSGNSQVAITPTATGENLGEDDMQEIEWENTLQPNKPLKEADELTQTRMASQSAQDSHKQKQTISGPELEDSMMIETEQQPERPERPEQRRPASTDIQDSAMSDAIDAAPASVPATPVSQEVEMTDTGNESLKPESRDVVMPDASAPQTDPRKQGILWKYSRGQQKSQAAASGNTPNIPAAPSALRVPSSPSFPNFPTATNTPPSSPKFRVPTSEQKGERVSLREQPPDQPQPAPEGRQIREAKGPSRLSLYPSSFSTSAGGNAGASRPSPTSTISLTNPPRVSPAPSSIAPSNASLDALISAIPQHLRAKAGINPESKDSMHNPKNIPRPSEQQPSQSGQIQQRPREEHGRPNLPGLHIGQQLTQQAPPGSVATNPPMTAPPSSRLPVPTNPGSSSLTVQGSNSSPVAGLSPSTLRRLNPAAAPTAQATTASTGRDISPPSSYEFPTAEEMANPIADYRLFTPKIKGEDGNKWLDDSVTGYDATPEQISRRTIRPLKKKD